MGVSESRAALRVVSMAWSSEAGQPARIIRVSHFFIQEAVPQLTPANSPAIYSYTTVL